MHNPNLYRTEREEEEGGRKGWEDNNWVVGKNVNMVLGCEVKYIEGTGGVGENMD